MRVLQEFLICFIREFRFVFPVMATLLCMCLFIYFKSDVRRMQEKSSKIIFSAESDVGNFSYQCGIKHCGNKNPTPAGKSNGSQLSGFVVGWNLLCHSQTDSEKNISKEETLCN